MLKKLLYVALGALAVIGIARAGSINLSGSETRWNRSYFEVGMLRMARDSGITAHAGGGQSSAYALTAGLNQITTVASANDSVVLPSATNGLVVVVVNAGANSANVFPASGDKINALSANTAFAVANGKTAIFFVGVDGNWYSILTA